MTKHYKEFLNLTCEKWISDAEKGEALKIMWDGEDEHGEPELKTYYVCLATNKTFISIVKANIHFKKNKSVMKEHNQALTKLKRDYAKIKQIQDIERAQHPVIKATREAKATNSPYLARCFWRSILQYSRSCKMMIDRTADRDPLFDMFQSSPHAFNSNLTTIGQWRSQFEVKMVEMQKLYDEKCLDWKVLEPLCMFFMNWLNTFMTFFDCFYDLWSFDSACCIRVPPGSLDPAMYWIANDGFPPVEF